MKKARKGEKRVKDKTFSTGSKEQKERGDWGERARGLGALV